MWLPDWLYNALPFIYTMGGLLSIYHANNIVGQGSGVLLIFAGFLVWNLRTTKSTDAKSRQHIK